MKTRIRLRPRILAAVAWILVLSITGACGAQAPAGPVLTSGPGQTSRPTADQADVTEPPAVSGGSWTGTITMHGVVNEDATTDVSSGAPGDTYSDTGTDHATTQTDVTDTYSVTGTDSDDVGFGISSVDLAGTATNQGTTLERDVKNLNEQNSGCTWKEELGTQVSGSWKINGTMDGSLRLNDDGSYTMDVLAGSVDANGYEVGPELPHHVWDTLTDISAGCVANTGGDSTDTQGPLVGWVSSSLGELDVNGKYADITGKIDGTPGTTIDGSITWNMELPAMKMDIAWHLVHSGPIVLPHS